MMAIAIMAQSATQTPTRSTTRDNPGRGFTALSDCWFIRGARRDIGERYRSGLKKSTSPGQGGADRVMTKYPPRIESSLEIDRPRS